MKYKLNLWLFLLPLFLFFVLNLVMHDSKTISVLEKRTLYSKPIFNLKLFFSGQYSREYDNYYSDHFAFRDTFVDIGSKIKSLKGLRDDEGAMLLVQKGNNMSENLGWNEPMEQPTQTAKEQSGQFVLGGQEQRPAAVDSRSVPGSLNQGPQDNVPGAVTIKQGEPEAESPQVSPSGEAIESLHVANVSDTYLVLKDRATLLYKFSSSSAEAYAKAINRLRASINQKVRIYDMLVPSQIEFLGIDKYRSLSDSQKNAFLYVNNLLDKTVTSIDAYGALLRHKDEYIYLRTDHHWTALGAYYAYSEFIKTIGEVPVSLSKYKTEQIRGYLGSAYAATLSSSLKKNPDTITLYIPFTTNEYTVYTSSGEGMKRSVIDRSFIHDEIPDYSVFLGGDFPWGVIKTTNQNKKRLLVLKDSYGNAFIPFLLPHYEEIYYIDPRHFKTNLLKFIEDRGITDVLLLNGSFVTTYSGISDLLDAIMSK